ncbi:hypothetical protein [Persicobacter diffluens]|uniref:hypothetical protein n=1 Tax=Persicobacter diffluens TaxID=981 RepID=UPI0030C77FD1
MTSSIDSTGVLVYVKGTIGTHGNTGEPPASTRSKGQYGNALPKNFQISMVYMFTMSDAKDESIS